jgi:hypothetical protein
MGMAKRFFMRQEEEGWRSVGDKYVCPKCFEDYAIQDFIRSSASEKCCSYCGKRSRSPIAAEMDEVLSFIARGLHREYEDPAENVGRDNESESGWAIEPQDTYDLFCDLGFGDGPEELFQDLVSSFSDCQWVQRNPYGLLACDEWRYSWEEFSNQVKHKCRFVFFEVATRGSSDWEPEPHTILPTLGRLVTEQGLVKTVPVAQRVFRVRQHDGSKPIKLAADIGTPPPASAIQSRMSGAGIPMFYGASDEKTAMAETVQPSTVKPFVTVGQFESIRPLQLLDLTNLPDVPSLFDEARYEFRMPLIFLSCFVDEVAKPIARDGHEHVDYIPTQIVAEYFRHLFRLADGSKLDGVIYPSSKSASGICYTVFCEQESCCDSPTPAKPRWPFEPEPLLLLKAIETRGI